MNTLLVLSQLLLDAVVLKATRDCLAALAGGTAIPPSQNHPARRHGAVVLDPSTKKALLNAINALLPEVGGFGSPTGVILDDLQQYVLVGKSGTAAQRRRINRRGRVWASVNGGRTGVPADGPSSWCSATGAVRPRKLTNAVLQRTLFLLAELEV